MRQYLSAITKLYEDRNLPNPVSTKSIKVNYPDLLLKALKKYEKVANRREVIADCMFQYIDKLAESAHEDSLISALNDWLKWSRYGGPRRCEWCQTTKTKAKYGIDNGPEDEPQAFTLDDIKLFDARGQLLNPIIHPWHLVHYIEVCWRFQKNGNNGERIKYWRDFQNERWCPCKPLWNIVQRALRLGVAPHEPLAKYAEDGNSYWITDKDVASHLQNAARVTLNIRDPEILSKWTSHSLRVTAANELHRLGFSTLYIKLRLRWKSDSFMDYLRHTIHVARNHTRAMSLSQMNLELMQSNMPTVNQTIQKIVSDKAIHRRLGDQDVLWEGQFYATAA